MWNVIAYDLHQDLNLAKENGFSYVDSVNDIYQESDFISLHLPLFPSTRHMINTESIMKMKDGVTLINTSRGGIINTHDLVSAIKDGKFAHVALDVVEHEDNLAEVHELLHLPNVIITPHIAYYTHESVDEMYRVALDAIGDFLNRKSLVNQVVGH